MARDEAEAWLIKEELYIATGGQDIHVRIAYYDKAIALFRESHSTDRLADALKILGDYYQLLDKFDQSLAALKESLALYKETKYTALQGLYDLIAFVSSQKGDYETGLRYGLSALKTARANQDTTLQLCTIINRIAFTYSALKLHSQAEPYYQQALDIAAKYKDTASVVTILIGDVSALLSMHKPTDAIRQLNYYSQRFPTKDKRDRVLIMASYLNAYVVGKQLDKAGPVCRKIQELSEALKLDDTSVQLALIRYFIATKQVKDARINLEKYKVIQKKVIAGKITYYLYAYKVDSLAGNFSDALNDHLLYTRLKDSLFTIKKNQQIQEIKIQYESEQQHNDIRALQKDAQVQEEKVRQANLIRNITEAGLAATLILMLMLGYSYRVNKKNAQAIDHNNTLLKKLVVEKEWLVKEIHHRVKNNLQVVTGLLQRQSAYINNDQALAAIQNSENRMHAIALIHQKLYQSESLDLISMPEYIDEMTRFLADSCGIENRIVFEKYVEPISLDVAQAVPLGLILNEAVTNAIKYAYKADETGTIYITLVKIENDSNQLTIADNGPGFPASLDLKQADSMGLNLIRGLCKQLGARLEFSNEQGCTMNITFETERFGEATDQE
ncbi:hypothetical protein BC343_25485 [Mucilaginibacter pedocola]|uniref:Histidine kinase domain-containing protein n=1 Tax=Mucilaginibacter pedocola TaxID=1792845 RepID=A0A1S9PHE8_9SPHI|nr:hypothetical protein BC343_25485 [Mucilaginibacter pedocola]